MSEKVEVRAELRVDDMASGALNAIKGGFTGVGHKVGHVQSEILSMGRSAVATAVGFQFDKGIDSLKELATESFHAALAAKAEQGMIATSLSLADKQGRSFMELKTEAVEYHDKLEEIGIMGGVASSKVIEAFADVAARSNKTSEEVLEFTEQMVYAGKAWPGGIEAIAGGFEAMQMGLIRGKNPIVQIIAATHTLGGTAKEVAAQLQKMSPEEAMALGEKAIGKLAEKAKDMPLGFKAIVGSLKDIRENLFETMGMPMVGALTGELGKLRTFMLGNKGAMEEYAKVAGEKAGEWIKAAGDKFREGFAYIQTHAQEIKEALTKAAEMIKEAFAFAVAHKDELLKVAEMYAMGKMGGVAKDMAMPAVGVAKSVFDMGKGAEVAGVAGTAATFKGGIAGGGMLGGAVAVSAALAALASVTWAVVEAKKFEKEHAGKNSEAQKDISAVAVAMKEAAMKGQTKEVESLGKKGMKGIKEDAHWWEDTSAMEAEMTALTNSLADISMGVVKQTQEIRADVDAAEANVDANAMVMAYNRAVTSHNDAAAKYAAEVIMATAMSSDILVSSGMELAGGLDKFAEIVGGASQVARDRVAGMMGMDVKGKGAKPPAPALQMSGGQTFNIKQEFRDQDPDRVLYTMRKDIIKQAEQRRQSRLGTPFGF